MKKKEPLSRKLIFGIFYLFSSSITSIGFNVITVAFIARKLGVENFGLFSAITSFVGLFQFLSDFGLNRTLLKHGSTDKTKAQMSFGNALFAKGVLIIPTLIFVNLAGLLAGYKTKDLFLLELFTVSMIFESYGTVFSSIRRILGDFKLISFFRVVRNIVNLVIVVIALTLNNSVFFLALANVSMNFFIFISSLLNTIKLLKPKLNLKLINDFFKDSTIFSLSDFFLNIYGRISIVLLSFFSDLHIVGIFSAAVRATKIANILPNQVNFALLPTMYRVLENRNHPASAISETDTELSLKNAKKAFDILFKFLVVLATLGAILVFFFSDEIIHLVFGYKYNLAIPLVKILSLFIYLRFISTPFRLFYNALHKNLNMLYIQGVSSLVLIILDIILIPKYSAYGACYATIISELLFGFMLLISGLKFSIWKLNEVLFLTLKTLASAFISLSIVMYFLGKINIFIQIVTLTFIYLLMLFAIRTFNKTDKEILIKVLKDKSKK